MAQSPAGPATPVARRMSAAQRKRQLLDVATDIVRVQGVDYLKLSHLASRAGVSKPVVYDHFGTRSALLIDLYRDIDAARVAEFRAALHSRARSAEETVESLAVAYIDCAADTQGEFFAVGAALSGSEEKAAVLQELLDNYVTLFAEVLAPCSSLSAAALQQRCVGLVGAGEALSSALIGGRVDYRSACDTLTALITGGLAG